MPSFRFIHGKVESPVSIGGDVIFGIRNNFSPGVNDSIFLQVDKDRVEDVRHARNLALSDAQNESDGTIRVIINEDGEGSVINADTNEIVGGLDVTTCLLMQIFITAKDVPIPRSGNAYFGDFHER